MGLMWQGDNPYYLLCVAGVDFQRIDLDEYQWATTYADWMRRPGEWHLIFKEDDGVALSIMVWEGEQPYYTSRVFGSTTSPTQVRAYGIGKKLLDGTMMRLWILETGQICGGDDVDAFGVMALK